MGCLPRATILVDERRRAIAEWCDSWNCLSKAPTTRRAIPDLDRWLNRTVKFEPSFHSTKAPTGHRCYRAYLHHMSRAPFPECLYCGAAEGDVEYTLFACPHWVAERLKFARTGGSELRVDDLTDVIYGLSGRPAFQDDGAGHHSASRGCH